MIETMKEARAGLVGQVQVYRKAAEIIRPMEDLQRSRSTSTIITQMEREMPQHQLLLAAFTKISYIGGILSRPDVLRFKRLIFRASKGRALP